MPCSKRATTPSGDYRKLEAVIPDTHSAYKNRTNRQQQQKIQSVWPDLPQLPSNDI